MKKILLVGFILLVLLSCKSGNSKNDSGKNNSGIASPVISEFQEQIKKFPDSVGLRLRFVDALDSLKQFDLAVNELDTLIKKDAANYGLWFRRGKLLENAKDTANAMVSYNNALKIYPSPDGQLYLANLLAEKKDKHALDICNNVLNLRMGRDYNAHCHFISGVYYSRISDSTKAFQQFDECILNNYSYMEAYLEKGFIYFDAKNYDEALKIFKTAANINSTYPDAYYWIAKCNEAKGNKPEAIKNYETSLQLDSTSKEASNAIKRLGK